MPTKRFINIIVNSYNQNTKSSCIGMFLLNGPKVYGSDTNPNIKFYFEFNCILEYYYSQVLCISVSTQQ